MGTVEDAVSMRPSAIADFHPFILARIFRFYNRVTRLRQNASREVKKKKKKFPEKDEAISPLVR